MQLIAVYRSDMTWDSRLQLCVFQTAGDKPGDLAFLFSLHTLPLQSENSEMIPKHRKVGYLGE